MRRTSTLLVPPIALATACQPLPDRPAGMDRGRDAADGPGDASTATVDFDPPADAERVPRVVRIRIRPSPRPDAGQPAAVLVRGDLSDAALRAIAAGSVPKTVAERAVPFVSWTETGDPPALVVAPVRALDPGERYALGVGSPPRVVAIRVATWDGARLVARTWPPPGDAASSPRLAVWCAADALAAADSAVVVEPGGRPARLRSGVGGPLGAPSCLRMDLDLEAPSSPPAVPPPVAVLSDASAVRLDPEPLAGEATAPPIAPLACGPTESPLGPGCLELWDDRGIVRAPAAPSLWAVRAGATGPVRVRVPRPGGRFVVRPFAPGAASSIAAVVVDRAGRAQAVARDVKTGAARPHVVLSEVYANPNGPEPAQEWVEIFNDGPAAVSLGGWRIEDDGGKAVLPAATLEPGAFALVVNDAYAAVSGADPPPAPGTMLLRVPKLGAGGLSNEGEAIVLRDPGGEIRSRFPALPKPKAGVSVARTAPDALDDEPGSFALDPSGSSTPGAPNPGWSN